MQHHALLADLTSKQSNRSRTLAQRIQYMPEMSDQQRNCLIVILGKTVKLAKGGAWPIASLVSEGKCYRDAGFGGFTEFYDWLRNSCDEVLGVRYYLCSDTDFLFGYAQEKNYMLSK